MISERIILLEIILRNVEKNEMTKRLRGHGSLEGVGGLKNKRSIPLESWRLVDS